jgi:hypothetical protein
MFCCRAKDKDKSEVPITPAAGFPLKSLNRGEIAQRQSDKENFNEATAASGRIGNDI